MVVVFHLQGPLRRYGFDVNWPLAWAAGVDVFFVISGFIMWVTTWRDDVTPAAFLRRRLTRIVPLYWTLTLAAALAAFLRHGLGGDLGLDLTHLVKSLLFWPAENPMSKDMEPVLVPGWTLNYEMFFYALFALALALRADRRVPVLVLVLAGLAAAHVFAPAGNSVFGFYTQGIILEFGFGVLIGRAYTKGLRIRPALALAAMCLGVLGIVASTWVLTSRVLSLGVAAALIVFGAAMYERARAVPRHATLHLLGDASYSIYLAHGFVLGALAKAWQMLDWGDTGWRGLAFVPCGLLAAAVVGVALFRWVERPFMRLFRRRAAPVAQPA